MGIFDFFKKDTKEQDTETCYQKSASSVVESTNLFNKEELRELIEILATIAYLFRDSQLLQCTGGGRNEKMKSRLFSYAGILGYLYEIEYKYGAMSDIVDQNIAAHYLLVKNAMTNSEHRKRTILELADNWSDVLQVIFNLQLEPNPEGAKFKSIEHDIQKVSKAMEKLSGSKCKEPKDPRQVVPRNVSYNPFNITENRALYSGHVIPDITNSIKQDLLPQLLLYQYSNISAKEMVVNYAIVMIKSYYNNYGIVPMIVVDMITGQINQVVEMVQRVSYTPYDSLKEYLLSKIYK